MMSSESRPKTLSSILLPSEKRHLLLRLSLRDGTYKHGEYLSFCVNDTKRREIAVASIRMVSCTGFSMSTWSRSITKPSSMTYGHAAKKKGYWQRLSEHRISLQRAAMASSGAVMSESFSIQSITKYYSIFLPEKSVTQKLCGSSEK